MPATDRAGRKAVPRPSWMESVPMSLAASQRRDQRRRLVVPWNRSDSTSASPSPSSSPASAKTGRRPAAYANEALPEHQPSLATLLPASLTGFTLTAIGVLALLAAAVGVGVWESASGGPLFDADATRFSATLAALHRCVDIHSFLSLGGWLAQICLVIATVTALIVRLMRQHRRDDRRGRSRAWGWLAGLFMITACAGQVPLGTLIASLVTDTTGITLGPNGMGWWLLTAGILYGTVGLWAVLPLYERAATGIWLSLCLSAWAAAAAAGWIAVGQTESGREGCLVIGNVCWMAGAALAAISMLAAARSVVREVRGLPAREASGRGLPVAASTPTIPKTIASVAASEQDDEAEDIRSSRDDHEDDDDSRSPSYDQQRFVDGEDASDSDDEVGNAGRHLSKSERKRLKKLARMGRAA